MGVTVLQQFPMVENRTGPQTIEFLTKRIVALGAVQVGHFLVDCETYMSVPTLGDVYLCCRQRLTSDRKPQALFGRWSSGESSARYDGRRNTRNASARRRPLGCRGDVGTAWRRLSCGAAGQQPLPGAGRLLLGGGGLAGTPGNRGVALLGAERAPLHARHSQDHAGGVRGRGPHVHDQLRARPGPASGDGAAERDADRRRARPHVRVAGGARARRIRLLLHRGRLPQLHGRRRARAAADLPARALRCRRHRRGGVRPLMLALRRRLLVLTTHRPS